MQRIWSGNPIVDLGRFCGMAVLEPFVLEPAFQTYLWGGTRLKELYPHFSAPDRCAEVWLASDRPEGMSRVHSGPFKGWGLSELVERFGEELLGKGRKTFPILVKLIDAKEPLSIQVHPCEASAPKVGGEAKSELWYMLEKGAVLAGLKRHGESLEEAAFSADGAEVAELFHRIEMQADEALFVPGGCPHAILGGTLLLEIQQNSNTTYRLFDWGRKDSSGAPRPLHIEKAIACMGLSKSPIPIAFRRIPISPKRSLVSALPHFKVEFMEYSEGDRIEANPASFQVVFCQEKGSCYLLGAQSFPLILQGSGHCLRIFL